MAPFSYGMQSILLISLTVCQFSLCLNVPECPEGCFCTKKTSENIPGGIGFKITCRPTNTAKGTFEIHLPPSTVNLDLTNYGLKKIELDDFSGLVNLQKLDLQGNAIATIEPGSFRSLPKLEILDLSRNNLTSIEQNTFVGLASLQKLKLTDNNIRTIQDVSFAELRSLKKVELSDNSLVCDCHLKWFVEWASKSTHGVSAKCALPISLADKPIKNIETSTLSCTSDYNSRDDLSSTVRLSPSHPQIVFVGDSLSFHCQIDNYSGANSIKWLVNNSPLEVESSRDISIVQAVDHGVLTLSKLKAAFKGVVSCAFSDGSIASVDVLVLTKNVSMCQAIVSDTSRGQYKWSATVGGVTLKQVCQRKPNPYQVAEASLQCRHTGEWAAAVNVSQCAYTSNVTDDLHKFASMNTSFDMNTLLDSAKFFLNYTSDPKTFLNPMDLVYFSQAVENYLPYMTQSNDVGHYMMDMMANVLAVSPKLMSGAQRHGLACRRLLNVMDNITAVAVPAFKHRSQHLAMYTHNLKPMQPFSGMTCTWYSIVDSGGIYQQRLPRKPFLCNQDMNAAADPFTYDKQQQVLVSVTIPKTLYRQIDFQPVATYPYAGEQSTVRLMFAAFINSSLFPTTTESMEYEPVSSYIIGCQLLGSKRYFNLTDQIIITIRLKNNFAAEREAQPVYWDQYSNGGYGSWNSKFCHILNKTKEMIKFSCSRLGYYGVRYLRSEHDPLLIAKFASKWHHPTLYISGCISGLLILTTIVAFAAKYPAIQMARELKHSFLNVWTSSLLLLFLYLVGIYQTQKRTICQFIALLLHLFTISTFIWLLTGVYIVYSKVSKRNTTQYDRDGNILRGPLHHQQQQQQTFAMGNYTTKELSLRGQSLNKPLRFLYIFAYGIPTCIVAVTAAIDIDNHYQTKEMCFLNTSSMGLFIGAMVVPLSLIVTVMIGFSMSALFMGASPSRVKETGNADEIMLRRMVLVDKNSSPKTVILVHGLQYLLLSIIYFTAGVQLTQSWTLSYVTNLLLCILISAFMVGYGAYLMCNYVIFREEITGKVCVQTRKKPRRRKSDDDIGSVTVDQDDMTSNLVELCPALRPLPAPISNTLDRQMNPHASTYIPQSSLPSRIKDVNIVRDDPYFMAQPPNSEVSSYPPNDYPSLFGPSSNKVNNLNIHPGMAEKLPKTSSPANSHVPHVPQDLTGVSPLAAADSAIVDRQTGLYSVVPLQYNNGKRPDASLASINPGLDYTESSTIRMGAPCDLATPSFDLGPSMSLIGVGTPKRLLNLNKIGSLPKSLRSGGGGSRAATVLETQSNVGSTKSGHSKASGRKRHKKPNRRRSRNQIYEKSHRDRETNKEPLYNNVIDGDDSYMGDDDHFDTIERHRRTIPLPEELPSIIHEVGSGSDDEDHDADVGGGGREQPAILEDLPDSSQLTSINDLPKRETSV